MNNRRKEQKANKLGKYYASKSQQIKAIFFFKRAISFIGWRYSQDETIHYNIAKLYLELEMNKEAFSYINECLTFSWAERNALQLKWEILKALWEKSEAEKFFTKVVEIDNKVDAMWDWDIEAYCNL